MQALLHEDPWLDVVVPVLGSQLSVYLVEPPPTLTHEGSLVGAVLLVDDLDGTAEVCGSDDVLVGSESKGVVSGRSVERYTSGNTSRPTRSAKFSLAAHLSSFVVNSSRSVHTFRCSSFSLNVVGSGISGQYPSSTNAHRRCWSGAPRRDCIVALNRPLIRTRLAARQSKE
jgi:hypothetical protein